MILKGRDEVALALLGLAETLGAWGNLCPSAVEVAERGRRLVGRSPTGEAGAPFPGSRSSPDPGDERFCLDLRGAYVRSGLVSAVIAGAAALLSVSLAPLGGWAAGTAVALVAYETALPAELRLDPLGLFRPSARPLRPGGALLVEAPWR